MSMDVKPHAFDPVLNPELFEGVLARRVLAFFIDFVVISVPLVLAMGLGFGNATNAVEGFGILSMASIGPVITVMISGLWSRYKASAQIHAAEESPTETVATGEGIV